MGQFKALSQKNWILWKRGWCGNIIEVIIPIIFIAFIAAIRKLVKIEAFEEQSFISNPLFTSSIYGQQSTALAAGGSTFLKNCTPGTIVGLAPTGNAFVSTLNSKLSALGYTTQLFTSDADITSRVRSFDYGVATGKFCFAVTISQATAGGSYKYKLHFNESAMGNTQGPASTLKLMIDNALDIDLFRKTKNSGMMGTTTFINNLILQQETGTTTDVFKNVQGPIYQQKYQKDDIYTNAKNNVGIIFLLPLLIVYLRQTSIMLSQKQKKIRETMNIMGMQLPVYYVTWFIRYFVTCLVIHLIGSAIIAAILPKVGFIIPFIIFILFDIVLIIQSFFIQTFFTRAKLGVVIALLFFLIQYIISFISSNSDNPTLSVNTGLSIIPHIAFILSFETMLYAESVKVNASFTSTLNNYTIGTCIISCVLNALVYLFLTWYLEQVFPNEFGSKKHPLFCCFGKKNQVSSHYSVQEEKSDSTIKVDQPNKPDVEEVEQKYKVMETQKKIVNIQNLRKEFNDGDFVAVNNLSLKMYNDNIFVLLGHNGAGKTTTISMLTGMLEPTSGLIEVCGETQLQKIRQSIGICPQHDTLYEDLTVREHLELFGTFRGLTGEELDDEVNKLISDVNLYEKRDEYSKNLSGGQKRRLSVAMAFAGRSKVIILDEPTSGMDTSARRYIWELLKSYKSNRIILLTTHFMDEADYLGDRIGIMAGGRLICCGSGHYLKNKFGVGYNITFVKKESKVSSDNITSTVQRHISRAILLSDVSSQITMQLPMDEVKKFPALFNEIDSKKDTLGITTYGISITTLQQVFLKVGEDTHSAEEVRRESLHQVPKQVPSPTKKKDKQVQDIEEPMFDRNPAKLALSQETFFEDEKLQRIDGAVNRFFIHLKATILKRLRVIKRDYKSFILELLLPMAIIILALLLMQISFIKDLPQQELAFGTYLSQASPIEIPIGSGDSTLLNGIQTKLNSKYGSLVSVSKDTSSVNAANFDTNFLKNKKASTRFLFGGLFFNGPSTVGADTVYEFTTVTNTKVPTSSIYLQTLAAESYINQIRGSNITISIVNSPFVRTSNQLQINNTISGFFGALIFSIALGFKFASIISFIVKQREDRSKHQQIVSGMNIIAYWFGNFIYDYLLYLILAIFSFAMCQALSVDAFTGQAYGVTVLVFILYGLAYIPLTYICAYLFKDYGNAQAGFYFFTFVVGGLLSIVVLVLRFLDGDANTVGLVLGWIFRFIPSYCFGQILINLGSLTLLSTVELGLGKKYSPWDMKISWAPFIYLIVEIFAYTLFVFLIESAFNNENFMRFWTSESKVQETQQITDSDVIAMKQKALNANPHQYEILTKNLRKVYMLDSAKKHKVAVDNLSVAIEKGEVFGLLGVNGAGKTTTFKMLAGQITSTSGDSYFTGMKISENLKRVRQNLGYCPQFDALIENLTVREQLQLFYDLKSLPSQYKDEAVSQKIREMNLQQYEDKLSGTLSGGNKRKLSVAMAMIGNPNIIFLDEPSTGMDPKARRFMWKIISRIASQKKQSTIILTTHSMEQAEALSTKLGIMVNGNFKCIGTPQHIKSKYGDGYEIEIKVDPCTKEQISNYMAASKLENKNTIQEKQLEGFLSYLKVQQATQAQISPKGNGNYIYNQLVATKKIETFQIVEYLLLVQKIKKIKQFMQSRFGGCQVIESFQTFIRFKVKATLSVGKMFEVLQTEKTKLEIDSYSIKQATVEQIFNRFAEDGEQSELMG